MKLLHVLLDSCCCYSKTLIVNSYFIPCWKMELILVLQISRSAHCTITMLTKNPVWHVYSSVLRWAKLYSSWTNKPTHHFSMRNALKRHTKLWWCLGTNPLLSITVSDKYVLIIPFLSDPDQRERKKPILSHDDKVCKEASQSLISSKNRHHRCYKYAHLQISTKTVPESSLFGHMPCWWAYTRKVWEEGRKEERERQTGRHTEGYALSIAEGKQLTSCWLAYPS